MLPEWLSIGIPRYTERGGPGNSRNMFKWVSQLEMAGISPGEPQVQDRTQTPSALLLPPSWFVCLFFFAEEPLL